MFEAVLNICTYSFKDEKRAHHNALERKRRDHIKDSFNSLRDAVPNIQGEKVSNVKAFRIYKSLCVNCFT